MPRKHRKEEPFAPCPRCGMDVQRLERHLPLCERLPLPTELAQDYAQATEPMGDLATRYKMAATTLRERIVFGLERLGLTWEDVQTERRARRMAASRTRTAAAPPDARRCSSCTILLADDNQGQLCPYCLPGAADYLALAAQTAYEGL